MQVKFLGAFALVGILTGCATAPVMENSGMSHEEMMRHCQMMEQHQAQGGHDASEHDPARHGGMTHEQMMQHCAEMRAQHSGEEPAPSHPH